MFSNRRGSSSSNPIANVEKKAKKKKNKKGKKKKRDEQREEVARLEARLAEVEAEKDELVAQNVKLVAKEAEREELLPVTDFLGGLTGPYLSNPSMQGGSRDETCNFSPSRVVHVPFSIMFVDQDKKNQLALRTIKRSYAAIISAKLYGNSDTNRVKIEGVSGEADIAFRATAVTKTCNDEILIPNVVLPEEQLATFLEQRAGTTQGTKRSSRKRGIDDVVIEVEVPTAGLRPDVLQVQFPDPIYRIVGEYKFILPLSDIDVTDEHKRLVSHTPVDVASMYNDIANGVGVRCAVNQIYSYMVVLELRYAYLCTYNTWWFLKRTRDVDMKQGGTKYEETGKETLYISEPICVDSVGSSAKKHSGAAAAPAEEKFSLCEAYCYFALTAINDETAVGYTAAAEILGRVIKTYPKFPNNAKLQEDKKKLNLAVRDFMHQRFTGSATTAASPGDADLEALVVLIDKLPLVELPREPEYIEEVARGRAGTVFKCRVVDVPFDLMIKIMDLIRTPELRDEMELEYECYCRMVPLWGTVVPFCIWAGSMPNLRVGLVTSIAGEMGLGEWVSQGKHNVKFDTLASNLTYSLAQIHARGVAHGDVTARNIMIDDDGSGRVMFVDFGCSTILAPDGSNAAEFEVAKQDDLDRLQGVLGWVKHYLVEVDEPSSPDVPRKRVSLRIA